MALGLRRHFTIGFLLTAANIVLGSRTALADPRNFSTVDVARVGSTLHLCGITVDGGLWHTVRAADGTWQKFGDIKGEAGNPGRLVDVACAAIGPSLHVAAVDAAGGLWHTVRSDDGTWTAFGDVRAELGVSRAFAKVDLASVLQNLDLCAVTTDGGVWHTIRQADGTWLPLDDVKAHAGRRGDFVDVGCATIGRSLHLSGVTSGGTIWHAVRASTGAWTPFGNVLEAAGAAAGGMKGSPTAVDLAAAAGEIHLCTVPTFKSPGGKVVGGAVWHTVRATDGLWTTFGQVTSEAGKPGEFASVSCATVGSELQLSGTTTNNGLWHTVRAASGNWTPFGDVRTEAAEADPTREVFLVDQPNVKQLHTDYSDIRFSPGDRVAVTGAGCVQTGGIGKTWKRYVDPKGPNADRLYYGLVYFPGVNGSRPEGYARFRDVQGVTVPIPTGDAAQMFLRLGYEDDNYGDNGYWGHDDGTGDQCKNVGPAAVEVVVQHPCSQWVRINFVRTGTTQNLVHLGDTPQIWWSVSRGGPAGSASVQFDGRAIPQVFEASGAPSQSSSSQYVKINSAADLHHTLTVSSGCQTTTWNIDFAFEPPKPPVVEKFAPTKDYINVGDSTNLSWSVKEPRDCGKLAVSIKGTTLSAFDSLRHDIYSGSNLAAAGSLKVEPAKGTAGSEYTLVAQCPASGLSASAKASVSLYYPTGEPTPKPDLQWYCFEVVWPASDICNGFAYPAKSESEAEQRAKSENPNTNIRKIDCGSEFTNVCSSRKPTPTPTPPP